MQRKRPKRQQQQQQKTKRQKETKKKKKKKKKKKEKIAMVYIRTVLPMFSSRIFMVSCLIFRFLFIYLFIFVFLPFSWATLVAYGGSQARGRIGAIAAGLHRSHSNLGYEPHLQPTPQFVAMPDP